MTVVCLKRIAVYCGASSGSEAFYQQAAQHLGKWLVENDLDLVYGGGRVGLMGILADTVLSAGGRVYGVMPQELADREIAHQGLTSLKVVPDMSVRKKTMLTMADGCIALPGGPGTLEEIIEAYSWARIGDNENPCAFYNIHHYYDPLKTMFDQMTNQKFLTRTDRAKLLFSDSLSEIKRFMAEYVPPKVRTY